MHGEFLIKVIPKVRGASGVRRAYSEAKRARLTAVKDAYDPDNVFHINHNIAPTGHCGR